MSKVSRIGLPPPGIHAMPTPVSTLAFDTQQELLWTGNEYGRVTSFYGPKLQKYTSVRAHLQAEGPVKQFLFHDKGVISIAAKSVHLSSRRGLTQWHIVHDNMKDLRCMSFTCKGTSEILVAGCQDLMFQIDVEKGRIIEEIPTDENYTMMKSSHYICAATSTGSVNMLDPNTFSIIKTWKAHTAGINDMDARNNFLVTCGWSPRHQGSYMLDPLANVYDLKTMMPLPPIPFHAGAAFVRMHPRMSTTSIVASQTGQLQVVDLMNPNTANLRQANISSYMMGLELASSGEALALTDVECTIHLWGSPAKIHFAEYSNATEFVETIPSAPAMGWDSDTPLSNIGMPYYREQLLSVWPSHQVFEIGKPPPKIDSAILAALTPMEFGAYAPNPRKTRRNQTENTRGVDTVGSSLVAPKFLSEKARDSESEYSKGRRISDAVEALADASISGSTKADVPVMYRNVEIKYSRYGVDDFDFEYYNKTRYSGLETHISNSYSNPLLQLLKFTPLIRNLALHHAATTCLSETCLLCEMGFLFDMLAKANGHNCQATNFLKTFSNLPQAAALGLLEENSPSSSLTAMIQSMNRFLLDRMSFDFKQLSPNSAQLEKTIAIEAESNIRCVGCTNETTREGTTYVNDLMYPPLRIKPLIRSSIPSFSQILKASVGRETQTRGWCHICRRYQQLATRKTVLSIPFVLMINAAINTPDAKQSWATAGWLPEKIGIIVDGGQFFCFEGEDLQLHLQRNMHNITVYELVGMVADINSGENQKSHLVSLINVALSSSESTPENAWHLFNDFLVRKVQREDALKFSPSWKLPSIIAYQVQSARHSVDDSWKENLDTTLLYYDWSINHQEAKHHRVLRPEAEAPVAGSNVAIDAEFVSLQEKEIEIKSDGTRETIRPERLGLARVSVLRGSGEDEGLPFINDYITISEPVVDLLTQYSGIHADDLDPRLSTHNLVPLKVAYKKLWLLLNLGVVFIGHGLPKDFRTINIHVPKAQVLDTVDLFYIKSRGRKLSLRFLAWYLLKEEIQLEEHDSIEDARTALRLWRKYEEFADAGIVERMVEECYRVGREVGFKPPVAGSTGMSAGLASAKKAEKTGTSVAMKFADDIASGPATPVGRKAGLSAPPGAGKEGYFGSPLR